MNFYTSIRLKFILYKNKSFIWDSKKNSFTALKNIESINIDLLTGIDRQKSTLLKNTISSENHAVIRQNVFASLVALSWAT